MVNWIVVVIVFALAFLYMLITRKQDRKEGYKQGVKENKGRPLNKWEMMEYHTESTEPKKGFCILEIGETSLKIELRIGNPFDANNFWVEFEKNELKGIEKGRYHFDNNGELVKR